MEKKILKALRIDLNLEKAEARNFLAMMVERYDHLFPDEIQPRGSAVMFIRKEVTYLIQPIDENGIEINPDPVESDGREIQFFTDLRRLDTLVEQDADWDDIEDLLWSIRDPFEEAFRVWLVVKGLDDRLADDLAGCLFIWFDFIYAYDHDEKTSLANVPPSSWLEFFHDFLLRKMVVEPPMYVHWPPALKLFYRYLEEREYIESALETIELIRAMEPGFYAHLDEQFG